MRFTSVALALPMQHRRVVGAVPWGMPAVNFDAMFRAVGPAGVDDRL